MVGTQAERKALQTRAAVLYVVALSLFFLGIIFGAVLQPQADGPVRANPFTFSIYVTLARIAWIWGSCVYAKSKGHTPLLGLLGIFGIVAPIVIALMPDRFEVVPEAPTPTPPPAAPQWEVKTMPGTVFFEN